MIKNGFMQALEYFNGIRLRNISMELIEFGTCEGLDNYFTLLDEILKNESDISSINIKPMDIKRVCDLSSQIVNLIYGNYVSPQKIHKMYEKVVVTGGYPFDGSVIGVDGKEYITIGKSDTIQSIPTLTHEGSHLIIPNTYLNNAHILDTLPILTELISSIILDGMHIGESNFENTLILRIASLRDQIVYKHTKVYDEENEKTKYIKSYVQHSLYNYLISFVYAINLLIYYLEDARSFLNKLDNSLKNDENVYDFLRYYGIDFTSSSTIDNAIKVLKNTP